MKALGLDLSLTAPGYAHSGRPGTLLSTRASGIERLSYRAGQIVNLLDQVKPDLVVIEGYVVGQKRNSAGTLSTGELGGVARLILYERGVPFAEVHPGSLKKYATGRGNAPKDNVIAAALAAGAHIPQRRAKGGGREYDDNAADAWWLWQMGLARYTPNDERVAEVPLANRQSLNSVKWPKLTRKVVA